MSQEPIRVAVILPLSGGEELFGRQGLQGATMAAAEINARGGLLGGRPLELQIHDEQTDIDHGVELARQALADDVFAILGPVVSAERDLILPLCEQAGVPLLYATDYEGGAYSRYLFCYSAIPDHYVPALTARLLVSGPDVALIGADYVWPITVAQRFGEELSAHGGRVVSEQFVPMGTRDYAVHLDAIAASGAQSAVAILLGADGQAFLRQFAAYPFGDRPVTCVIAFNENYMVGLAPHEVEGIVTGVPFLSNLDRPETVNFVARQRAMFGDDAVVSYFAESHYGLLMFLADAIESVGEVDREAVIDALGDRTRVIGNGPVTLRAADHHMVLNMLVAEVVEGELIAVEDLGAVAPADQSITR